MFFLAKHRFLDRIYSNFLICQDDSAMDRTSSSTPYSDKEAQDELLSRDKQSNKTDEHSRMCKVCNIPVSQAWSYFAKWCKSRMG